MNKVFIFNIKGALGSFVRPQSNNNPSTFNIMPKSAVIGLIGAVIGLDKEFMKVNNYYKLFTEKIKYSIELCSPFKIKYWSEYAYNHSNMEQSGRTLYSPIISERLVDIDYNIYLLYDESDIDLNTYLNNFITNVKNKESVYFPYLGMVNFQADLEYIGEYTNIKLKNGEFITNSICTNLVYDDENLPFEFIRTDEIPTLSNSYLSHNKASYKRIFFHEEGRELKAEGDYYVINDNKNVEFI